MAKRAESYKSDIRLVSRVVWYKSITLSLKEGVKLRDGEKIK